MKIYFLIIALALSTGIYAQGEDSIYHEEEIVLKTTNGELFGTLTLPTVKKKIPVILIIAGSGPTDRNGNNKMMKNNSLKLLAEGMADHQIASVRYDKRGIGASSKSMQSEQDIRFEDYVHDANEWLLLLKQDKRFSEIIVLGHSEGSLIGMLTALKPDRFISIAGVGSPASVVLKKQLSSQPEKIKTISFAIIDSLSAGVTVDSIPPYLGSLFRPSVQPYLISWFKYDPSAAIKKMTMPVLIVQGKSDIQVDSTDANKLAAANPHAQLRFIDSMNHVLKMASIDRNENLKTYFDPTLPLADLLLPILVKFTLSKH